MAYPFKDNKNKANAYSAKNAVNDLTGMHWTDVVRTPVIDIDDNGKPVFNGILSGRAKEQQEHNKEINEQRNKAEETAKPIEWKSEEEKEAAVNAAKSLFKSANEAAKKDNRTNYEFASALEKAEEQWTDDKLGHILPYSTEQEIVNDNNALSTKLQLLWQKQYDGTATDEDYSAVAKYSKAIKARRQKLKEAFDKVDAFRAERENYFNALKSGRNPLRNGVYEWEADAITSDDGKIRYQNQVRTEFNNLWGKISGGTATDDDYRRYVTLEANYGIGLQKGLNALLDKSPDYHVSSVVDSWDKYGIPESEIWKDEEAYKADADKFDKAYNEAFEKYAKGELSEAELTALGDEYKQFEAKKEVFFSPRWQNVGTTKTTKTLELERDNAAKAIDEAPKVFVPDKAGEHSFLGGHFKTDDKYQKPYDEASARYQAALDYEQLEKEAEESQKKIEEYKKSGFELEPGELSGINVNNNSPDQVGVSMTTVPNKVKYSNVDEYLKALASTIYNDPNAPGAYELMTIADYGTEDEKATYAWIRQTKGPSEADKYARGLAHTLGTRAAEKSAEEYKNASNLERLLMGGTSSIAAGLLGDNRYALEGIIKTVTRDTSYTPANVFQQVNAGHMSAEDGGVAKTAMQAVRSSAAQLPSMAVGLGGASKVATALFTARAYGSARNDAINQGYGELEADGYALVSAGLEYASEKLFDVAGIYGGTSLDDAVKASISKTIGNSVKLGSKTKTVLSTLAYLGLNGAGESIEEGVVEFATPFAKNLILGENNALLDENHRKEIGNAMLVGLVSAYISPASIAVVSDAKANTAVWAVINGNTVTESQLDQIINNGDARSAFENYYGLKLSTDPDVAKAQVTAVKDAVSGAKSLMPSENAVSLDSFGITADNVVQYTESVADMLPKYNTEYVQAETDAVNEMLEAITPDKISAAKVIDGTASSADVNSVAKSSEAKEYFATQTGIQLSVVPSEARVQLREYINSRSAVDEMVDNSENAVDTTDMTPSEAITAVANDAAEGTVRTMEEEVSTVPSAKADIEDVQDTAVGEETPAVSINDGISSDEELADYAVSEEQADVEDTVANDERIIELRRQRDSGEITEDEYEDAVYDIISTEDSVESSEESDDGKPAKIMSKDEFDVVRNNSYSVTRNSAKDIKANPIFAKVSASDIRAFRAVGKALGVEVKAFDGETLGLTGTDGAYDRKTRTIYLNVTSPLKTISSAFRHEVIHYLKASSPKAFSEFATFVIDKYKKQYSDEDYNAWLEAKRKEYEAMGTTLTKDDAVEEFLAQYGMDMLQQKAIARDFVRHHRKAAVRIFEAIREKINEIRRFFGWKEVPSDVYAAIRYMAEDSSGQVQVSGNSYTRSHLQGSEELLPGELNIDALNKADEALLNAFVEVADINKRVQAKLKNAPADVLNDDVKRAEYIEELWAEETGVAIDNSEQIKYNKYWQTDLTKAEVIELSRIIRRDIRTSQNAITNTANWLFTQVNGKDVFVIYSTEEYNDPTILYESQKSKARFEHNYVLNLLGVLRNGTNTHGKSDIINQILASSRVRNISGVDNNAENVARRSGNRDGGVLQRQSKRRPSTALRSILENLFEIRDRHGNGTRGRVDADASVNASDEKTPVKFSMSKPVEQTKDLIAVHNLNSPKLRKALELGGFPMPSIAVTRADMGHDKFGDITLVFGRDTIDPAVDSDNKLYGGDAYTPTFPAVRYEANRNKVDELSTLYDDMRKRFGADDARPLYVYSDYSNAADALNRNGGEEGVIDYLKGDTNLMQLFLLDKTGNKVDTVMKRTEVKASDEDVKEYEFWINELGKDFFDGLTPPAGVKYIDHARQYFEDNKPAVLKTFSKMLTELYGYNAEEANNAVINSPESEFKSTLRRVYLYNKNGPVTVKEEPDYTATREQITKTAKAKGYDKWVEDTFKGIEGKKGIRNEKDLFTPSGKRRSFEDLHFDYTLDNIVRAMKQKNDKGISLFGGSIVGASAKNYKSVAQMKADSARLKQISQNEYDDIQKGFRDRFRELAVRLAGGKDSIDAGNLMAEAVAKYNTPSAIKNYIARESKGIYNYSDDIGNELLDIVNGIANMPTGYFEAKPKRAVGFDEVKFAVVPESIDADLRNGLDAVGTKVVTYRDGDSADRLEKLNSDSGVKFSKAKVDKTDEYTEEQYASFGWVRDNDILNSAQYGDFTSKFADAVSGNVLFNKTKNGEFIIPVSDISEPDTEGVNRFLVFAKGKIDKPVISSIIEIYSYNETELTRIRSGIYGLERKGIRKQTGELFTRYNAFDFRNNGQEGNILPSSGHNNGNGQRGRGGSQDSGASGTAQGKVKYSNSIPDSSDTAYIPKGEKPAMDTRAVDKLNKKLDKKIEKLEKTNADIAARLADAERRLKITKPYSPDSKQIDALAERIADTFIGEYRGKNAVSNIAKSLTDIFRTWNEGNVKGNINKLAEADRMISNLASTLVSGTSEYYGENDVVKALANELTEEITSITPMKSTAAVNALARTEEGLARTERKLNEAGSKLSAARDVIKLTESNLKKAEAQLESSERKLTVSTLRKESLQKKVDFLSNTRPIYIQKEIAQKRFDNANALADAAELDGLKSIALMYRNDAKFWQKQLDNVKKAEEYLDRKAMDRRRLREHISQKLGVPLATPDRSLPFVEQLKLVWNKHKNDSKELAVAKAVYKLNKEELKALLDFLKGEISYEEVIELGNKKTKDGEVRYNVDKILKLAKAMVNFANDEAVIADYNNETKRQRDKTTDEFLDRVDEAGGINDKGVTFNARATRETPERVIRMIVKDESLANEMINYYVKPIHTNEASANRFKNEVIKKVKDLKLETGIKKGNIVSESYAVQFVGEVEDNIRYLEKNAKSADTMRDGKTLLEWREALDEFKKSNPNLDFDRIHKAIDVFRGIYDDLFSRVNEARMLNGYPPMPYRSGYFPHFTDEGSDGLLSKAARSMGLSGTVSELPSNISGLTYMFKPGIKWMANAMERTGYLTAFDALEGLDRYLASASDVIFHTGDIQRLRSLERRIRYRATDNGIKDRVDLIRGKRDWSTEKKKNRIDKILNDAGDDITLEIQDKIRKIEGDTSLTIEEQDRRIAEIFENARFDGSNFVVWLGEYTNNLAGKQALTDRIMEQKFGRAAFNVVSKLEGRIAKNMIIGNMSSYMSNFIPLTQATAVLDSPASLTRGMIGTIRSIFKQDAVNTDSDFYRNRLGSDVLSMTFGEKFADKLLTPMEIIDKFVAGSIVRARYYDNLKKGMSESDAMDEADTMAANIMADRSKGSVPVIFNDKNPISKMFTMFQVEVNNQVSFWTKDISAEAKKRGVANMALRLMLASILAWLFNDWYEELTGRKPALSPIDIINDAVGKGFGVKMRGPTEIVKELLDGDDQYWNPEKVEDYGIWQGISEFGESVAEQLPFTSALNMFGLELDSGRIPVSGAYPDLAKLFTIVLDGKTSSEKKWDVAKDELVKPFYYAVLPMGGGQIKKINEGIGAIRRGGSYSNADKKGKRELQYPVFTDEGVWNIIKTVMFGKSSNEGAAEWVERGFKNALGDTATEVYISLKDSEAVSQRDVYNFLVELSGINKDTVLDGIIVPKDASADVKKRAFLRQSSLPDEVKAIIYAGYIADKKNDEPELELLERAGDDVGVMYTVISDMKDGNTDNDKRIVLWNGNLPEGDKYRLYKALMYNNGEGSESAVEAWQKEDKKIDAFWDADLSFDDYLKARIEKYGIEQKGLKPAAEANEFYSWARDNYGDEKAKVIYSTLPSSSGFVLGLDDVSGVKYADAGLSNDSANKVLEAISGLEPLPGKNQVSDFQKASKIISLDLSDKEKMGGLKVVLDDGAYEKVESAYKLKVGLDVYYGIAGKYDTAADNYSALDDNGKKKMKEQLKRDGYGDMTPNQVSAYLIIEQYGDGLNKPQKAALWQLQNKSWKGDNNPYGENLGNAFRKNMGWD